MRAIRRITLIFMAYLVVPTVVVGQYFDLGSSPSSIRWSQIKNGGNRYVFAEDYQAHAVRFMKYLDTIRPHINYGFRYGPMKLPIVMQPQNFASNGLVMLAPKRMELMVTPNIDAFSEPWLKQLATHEYRHAVQFSNLNRGVIKALSYIFGQQGSLVGGAFLPLWLMEGDATLAETQFSSYGRGLQPSFSIEYRAMIDQIDGVRAAKIDKWFCGSYRDYVPDHYKLGYQIATYGYSRYHTNIWDNVANYSTKYPFLIFTTKIALAKYYDTSVNHLFRDTFHDLSKFWSSQPRQSNSSTVVQTPITSYTTYSGLMAVNDSTVVALKEDLDRTQRFVEINMNTADERTLLRTGKISTPPTLGSNGRIYWSEYRTSTLWDLRVNSQLCYFDYLPQNKGVEASKADRSYKSHIVSDQTRTVFPTPLPSGDLAVVTYDYRGYYSITRLDKEFKNATTLCTLPDTISVHGMAYDDKTDALYYIGLSDCGMWIGSLDMNPTLQHPTHIVKSPAYITMSRLRAQDGKLYYHSIESGLDEVHMYDIAEAREYRISRSTYGSFDPAPMPTGNHIAMTTYDVKGYKLATQSICADSLLEVTPSRLPQNTINPPLVKWDVPNIDSVIVDSVTTNPVKRYRKGLHLINVHSWAPIAFDPQGVIGERGVDINVGATIMSQNLLNSAFTHLSYAWTEHGSSIRGGFTYNGFAPKIEVNAEYGIGGQLIGIHDKFLGEVVLPRSSNYFDISSRIYLPLMLSSGYKMRLLQPSLSLSHNNALMYNPSSEQFEHSLQKMTASIQYIENVRMTQRDVQPRWGYALKASTTINPFNSTFSDLWSFYARAYLPGIGLHDGITLRTAYQWQDIRTGMNAFRQKELFPRGARYDFTPTRYGAASFDYQLPLWCPDMGINSIIYFKRIRGKFGVDAARYRTVRGTVSNIYSYGCELIFDVNLLRTPSLATSTFSISVFKPSDHRSPVVGLNFSIPL